MKEIVKRNSFSQQSSLKESITGSGLFSVPSLLNHSCIANCIWMTIGDFMVVYTVCDVEAGEELTNRYSDAFSAHILCADGDEYCWGKKFLRNWGFECKCEVCTQRKENKEAWAEVGKIFNMVEVRKLSSNPKLAREIVTKVRKLGDKIAISVKGKKYFPHLATVLMMLGRRSEVSECITFFKESFEVCPPESAVCQNLVQPHASQRYDDLSTMLQRAGNKLGSKKAKESAELWRTFRGGVKSKKLSSFITKSLGE